MSPTPSPHTENRPEIAGLYLHVPFCFHKCHYCDFYSLAEPENKTDRHLPLARAIVREFEAVSESHRLRIETIFVGGGTPTLLTVEAWDHLLYGLDRVLDRQILKEWTVEANPETVTPQLAQTLVAGGVDRVSIGAQTFQPHLLKALERWHDPENVGKSVKVFRDAGLKRLNLDLIFAIPGQTLDDLEHDLDALLALDPDHLACYGLTFEPNTALTQKLRLGRVRQIDEDLERAMYELVLKRLADAGYEHYEISNWAKPGQRCEHNLNYWLNRNWLGIGPAAASHVDGRRWKNEPHLTRYLEQSPHPPITDEEMLAPPQRRGELLMLRLRLLEGAPLGWLENLLPAEDWRYPVIDELIAIGLLEKSPTHLRLSEQGLFLGDDVVARLL
ncbi:radical SAM family heme chaperone HemW [Mucisphaera sp.]|uniref:radical SAM family heme chaperone HemW n=1 Tax=Mucisphaera sp. TaxID=2913024 RepID=UPI003D0D87E1